MILSDLWAPALFIFSFWFIAHRILRSCGSPTEKLWNPERCFHQVRREKNFSLTRFRESHTWCLQMFSQTSHSSSSSARGRSHRLLVLPQAQTNTKKSWAVWDRRHIVNSEELQRSDTHVTHLIYTPQVAHVDSKDLLVSVGLAELLLSDSVSSTANSCCSYIPKECTAAAVCGCSTPCCQGGPNCTNCQNVNYLRHFLFLLQEENPAVLQKVNNNNPSMKCVHFNFLSLNVASAVSLLPYEPNVPEPTTRADFMKCKKCNTIRVKWNQRRWTLAFWFPQTGFPSRWMIKQHRSCCGFQRAEPKWHVRLTLCVRIPTGRSDMSTRHR